MDSVVTYNSIALTQSSFNFRGKIKEDEYEYND